jgi:hypothetical protein
MWMKTWEEACRNPTDDFIAEFVNQPRTFVSIPIQALKDTLANPERRWYGIDPARPGTDHSVEWSVPQDPTNFNTKVEIAPPVPELRPSIDHTWDMLVLAARSSRYGDETP